MPFLADDQANQLVSQGYTIWLRTLAYFLQLPAPIARNHTKKLRGDGGLADGFSGCRLAQQLVFA